MADARSPAGDPPALAAGLAAFAKVAWAEIATAAPELTRQSLSVAIQALAKNRECLELVAMAMAADEEEKWGEIGAEKRRVWMYRARAAFNGLDKFILKAGRDR